MSEPSQFYKKCSTCKEGIAFGAEYYVCSVSTCNRNKLALYFCSLPCWEAHVPEARHRDAWAEPRTAPLQPDLAAAEGETDGRRLDAHAPAARSSARMAELPGRRPDANASVVRPSARMVELPGSPRPAAPAAGGEDEDQVLIVVSKLKKYVRDRSGMNTSDTVVSVLSEHLRRLAAEAIRNAARDGRKTVMDRDFLPLLKSF